eukprot:3903728-Amphidinium_carterae.1
MVAISLIITISQVVEYGGSPSTSHNNIQVMLLHQDSLNCAYQGSDAGNLIDVKGVIIIVIIIIKQYHQTSLKS